MDAIYQSEDVDGVRFSWNVWPTSRVEATRKLLVPLGAMYTPMKQNQNTLQVPYPPLHCKGLCTAVLNPFCTVAPPYRTWVCPFCLQHNQFPPHYNGCITDTSRPSELLPNASTIEYLLPTKESAPPIYLYIVDTCLPDDELQKLIDSLTMSLSLIPENSYVGLITFGSMVQVYELGFTACPKSYVFRGNSQTAFKAATLLDKLGAPETLNLASKRFLVPVGECDDSLTTILEEIQKDPCRVPSDRRPQRATGIAFSIASSLLQAVAEQAPHTKLAARVMAFIGGPATVGVGMVVSDDLKEPIRSHHDIVKNKAKHTTKAYAHYKSVAEQAVAAGHVIDIFSCSLDQVGLYEMREMVKLTGGFMVLADGFFHPMFQQSFQKIFSRDPDHQLNVGYNADIQVTTNRYLKICGAIGHVSSLNVASPNVSENEIGIGGTSSWKVCGLDQNSTFAFYFEIANQHNNAIPVDQPGLIQFTTTYQNGQGKRIMRVTTVRREWADPSATISTLANGFDQETSAVLMARLAVFKAETEELPDITRWLDKMLIRLVSKYADFRKDDPRSFNLAPNFAIYPHFMFHLRRSNFLQAFNNSPDESSFYRFMLNRENVSNSLIMIQPTLEQYSFNGPPAPVVLSATSISANTILLLDTFFHVLIFHGEMVAKWRKEGYDKDPQHQTFRDLLAAPKEDAKNILKDRFPYPRYIDCDQHSGEARFLLATIDPNLTHVSNPQEQGNGEVVFTDDVNLHVFLEHLKKFAVQS
ncbi:putative transport protein [Cavenderia fasciculata]|uniref:Protein transport protein SEC23 n=1 Tax=Cavenderia fasciculata TaxID=261658 RepID=F4PGV6_CACFS|nr:putative transport protein [Cavenderia fasciculata]EGG24940.1 putative transport protein [Cavenderia fasciculata]|eukprot:XP_004362791.1 putative transport protein [Cavenderia fasciculata]